MKIFRTIFILLLLPITSTMWAQSPITMDLWQGRPQEKSKDSQDTARVSVYLPTRPTGRAILICPGGGYEHLSIDNEGHDWAPFFNSMGITVVVLKYRMPHGKTAVPISDAEEAIRLIRRNATEWKVDPQDVGIMGFSAGGHLASTIATHAKADALPNFQILFYPVISMDPMLGHMGSHDQLLGEKAKKRDETLYSNDIQVSRLTPRAIILLSDDDSAVPPLNGINYYTALHLLDIPASLYVYPTGGHGWGMKTSFAYHLEMLMNLRSWLNSF